MSVYQHVSGTDSTRDRREAYTPLQVHFWENVHMVARTRSRVARKSVRGYNRPDFQSELWDARRGTLV